MNLNKKTISSFTLLISGLSLIAISSTSSARIWDYLQEKHCYHGTSSHSSIEQMELLGKINVLESCYAHFSEQIESQHIYVTEDSLITPIHYEEHSKLHNPDDCVLKEEPIML